MATSSTSLSRIHEAERRLDSAYQGLPDGAEAPNEDSVQIAEKSGFGATQQFVYGEAAPQSIHPVLEGLHLQPDDVFCDLGSGRGRLVLGAAIMPSESQYACSRVVGIELDSKRHKIAETARSRLGTLERPCDLLNEDVLTAALDDITVALCNNVVFGDRLNGAIASALSVARAPKLRSVFSTAPLPCKEAAAAGLFLHKVSTLAVNWSTAGHSLYQYKRLPPPAGKVEVDLQTEKMIEEMRTQVSSDPELGPNSRDMAFMRIAAFKHQIDGEIQAWEQLFQEGASRVKAE